MRLNPQVPASGKHAFETCGAVPAALKLPDGDLTAELAAFMALHGSKTSFVLYPDKREASDLLAEAFLSMRTTWGGARHGCVA